MSVGGNPAKPVGTCDCCGKLWHGIRKGLCSACYTRQYRRGTTDRVPVRTPKERFWSFVNKDGPMQPHMDTPCWLWEGGRGQDDYGAFRWNDHTGPAHRFALEFRTGPLPAEIHACHHCDTPLCVRPDHLFPGDATMNNRDKVTKERQARGERIARSKLTADDVREARRRRAAGETYAAIARDLDVTPPAVRFAVKGTTWRHV